MSLEPSTVAVSQLQEVIQKNVRWNKNGKMELDIKQWNDIHQNISSKFFEFKQKFLDALVNMNMVVPMKERSKILNELSPEKTMSLLIEPTD